MPKWNVHQWLEYTLLAAIVSGYVLVGTLYAARTPAWQAPDEPAHYNYVVQILDGGCCPVIEMGDWDNDYLEQLKSARFDPTLTANLHTIQYEDHQPPLYYLLGAGVVALAGGADDTARALTALRLFSVALGVGVVLCAYAVARVMFPYRRGTALGAAALVAYLPQHVHILASVNNDALALLLVAVTLLVSALYIGEKRVQGALNRWHIGMGVLVGLAFLTKTTAYFLVFVVLLAVALRPVVMFAQSATGHAAGTAARVFGAVNRVLKGQSAPVQVPGQRRFVRNLLKNARSVYAPVYRRVGRTVGGAWAVVLVIALGMGALWWVRNSVVYGLPDVLGLTAHDEVVVGQLRTSERIMQAGSFGAYLRTALQTTFNSFWGQLGWMALPLPSWTYPRIGVLLAASGAGVVFDVIYGYRARRDRPTMRQVSVGLLLGTTAFFAFAAYIYYNTQFYQVQGRYLFTALIPFAILVASGLDAWARVLGDVLEGRASWLMPYTDYLVPLVLAGSFGAFNLWLIVRVLPFLAPV